MVPVAGCQLAPPSTETSTPATWPPPASVAVPVTVTSEPLVTVTPAAGAMIVVVGATESVDGVAATRPLIRFAGWTPMSPRMFTTNCCIRTSTGDTVPSWRVSRPQAYWTVPVPRTSAPLAARYSVMVCVVVPGVTTWPKSRRYSGVAPVVVDSRIRPAGRKPLSMSSSDS